MPRTIQQSKTAGFAALLGVSSPKWTLVYRLTADSTIYVRTVFTSHCAKVPPAIKIYNGPVPK